MDMGFTREAAPTRLTRLPIRDKISRVVANNPGPMTYHGTNTWLLDTDDGLIVIDPGPDEPAHIAAIAAQGRVAKILLTHTHPDHAGGASALKALSGAPVFGWAKPWAKDFAPDEAIADGQTVGPLIAIHTPGHASDHLCFAHQGENILFSGDHVMSWSTSVVYAPDGNMAAYMDGLRLLLAREDALYLCGHGPPLENPAALVRAMLLHRVARERSVLGALKAAPQMAAELVPLLYGDLGENLRRAAAGTVEAHLIKLAAEGHAARTPAGWISA